MRKIEEAMNSAITSGNTRTIGNTMVAHVNEAGQSQTSVYLHGHMIAQRFNGQWQISLAGWNTATTRSRLNALLAAQRVFPQERARLYTKRGTVYLQVGAETREIDSTGWHTV